jgi:hypothetical protein
MSDWIKKGQTIASTIAPTIGGIASKGQTIAAIIGGIGSVFAAWTAYNGYIEGRLAAAKSQILSPQSQERSQGVIDMPNILKAAPHKQWEIVGILESSIRKHSPVPKELNKNNKKPAPPDVVDAINVIKNRDPKNDNHGKNQKEERIINLAGLNLMGTDLEDAQLPRCSLNGSDLTNVSLKKANLEKAYLKKTYFLAAGLYKTNLFEAQLDGANLRAASLKEANLARANLVGANLSRSDLEGANLEGANLEKANLEGANLIEAKFTNEQIKKARNWHLAKYDEGRLEKLKRS